MTQRHSGRSLQNLAQTYADLAERIDGIASADDPLTGLVRTAAAVVPGAEYASVSQRRGDAFVTVARTDPAADDADRLQYELGEGPCVDAATDGGVFHTGDLAADPRWRRFGPRAAQEVGVRSLLSIRLYLNGGADGLQPGDSRISAGLNLYSTRPQAFGDESYVAGMLAATHGARLVDSAVAREQNRRLTDALHSNREIGVAMGILMQQHKLTRQQAFDLLRIASQTTNRKLAAIAADVADTGLLELPSTTARPKRH
jgi:hypothetical protein